MTSQNLTKYEFYNFPNFSLKYSVKIVKQTQSKKMQKLFFFFLQRFSPLHRKNDVK